MKVVALISGGKDSCYNMLQCVAAGHHVVALANLRPAKNTDELDSYMYQTVGHQAIDLYAEALDLPLYRRTIQGSSLDTGRDYTQTPGDEVEDLYQLLLRVKEEEEEVEAVSVGAILSDYQRVRVENVCMRLGLQPLAFLWRRDQETLLDEMIACGVHALLIKVAAFGLDPEKHLGKPLSAMGTYLKQLSEKYGVHICGEGGEYETFTLDCPLFKKRIVIDAMETVIHSADAFAPVGYLHFTKMHTEDKDQAREAEAPPLCACPCQNAIDQMTEEEVEYADQDTEQESTSNGDLGCQLLSCDLPPSCSSRSSGGYQWISGFTGLHSPDLGVRSQTTALFALLQGELKKRGWRMKHIVLVHLYIQNMDDFSSVNDIYRTHFSLNPPARVCVQAPLPPGQLLQMDCLLQDWVQRTPDYAQEDHALGEEDSFHRREALHVQSLSHWAPANIGPYSQAFRVDGSVFCAGQIALVPCSMQLVDGGARTQARLAFSHTEKVLEAVIGGLTLGHALQAHCYVTRRRDIRVVTEVWDSVLLRATPHRTELYGQSEVQPSTPLVVAVVPALPRGAAVELHVSAVHDDPRARMSWHMTRHVASGSIECQAVVSSSSQCATISLSLTVPSSAEPATGEVLQELGTTFHSAMLRMDRRLSPLCARVFYKCNHILAGQLAAGLDECLRSTLDSDGPSVVVVPVLGLPDSQILHLSCWLTV